MSKFFNSKTIDNYLNNLIQGMIDSRENKSDENVKEQTEEKPNNTNVNYVVSIITNLVMGIIYVLVGYNVMYIISSNMGKLFPESPMERSNIPFYNATDVLSKFIHNLLVTLDESSLTVNKLLNNILDTKCFTKGFYQGKNMNKKFFVLTSLLFLIAPYVVTRVAPLFHMLVSSAIFTFNNLTSNGFVPKDLYFLTWISYYVIKDNLLITALLSMILFFPAIIIGTILLCLFLAFLFFLISTYFGIGTVLYAVLSLFYIYRTFVLKNCVIESNILESFNVFNDSKTFYGLMSSIIMIYSVGVVPLSKYPDNASEKVKDIISNISYGLIGLISFYGLLKLAYYKENKQQ